MPGLAASSLVFENIKLENPNYQLDYTQKNAYIYDAWVSSQLNGF